MGGVALHRRHQVGDEVVAAFELDVDLGPRFLGPVALLDEAVERGPQTEDEEHNDDDDNDQHYHCGADLLGVPVARSLPAVLPDSRWPAS